jgi:tripartite-type tricarboxylate transporter receptor subunit TctC
MQMMFDVTPTSPPEIKAGKLRPLGVTTLASFRGTRLANQ